MDWYRLLPWYWIQNEATSKSWDKVLNGFLDVYGVTEIRRATCKVGPLEVWIRNWPYAYGSMYGSLGEELPLVKTRLRLKDAVEAKFTEDLMRELK